MNINLLLISLDSTILSKNSDSHRRMSSYATQLFTLSILVMTKTHLPSILEPFYATGFDGWRIVRFIKAYILGCRWIHERHINLVSVQDPFESGLLGFLISRRARAKLEVQLHGDFFGNEYFRRMSWWNSLRCFFGIFILRRAHAIRVVSHRIKQSLIQRGFDEKRMYVIPISSTNIYEEKTRARVLNSDAFNIVCVARLSKEKNVALIARALPYILGTIPHAHVTIVGEGSESAEIRANAKSLGVRESITLVGHQKDVTPYYRDADVVVIPSCTEGWGRVAIEAMGFSKVVVMTDVGLAGEVLIHEHNGLIIPIDDVSALVRAVISLYSHPELKARLEKSARATFLKLPSAETTYEQMFSVWQSHVST